MKIDEASAQHYEAAASYIERGAKGELDKPIAMHLDKIKKAFKHAKDQNDRLKKAGAGRTEAVTLLKPALSAIRGLHKFLGNVIDEANKDAGLNESRGMDVGLDLDDLFESRAGKELGTSKGSGAASEVGYSKHKAHRGTGSKKARKTYNRAVRHGKKAAIDKGMQGEGKAAQNPADFVAEHLSIESADLSRLSDGDLGREVAFRERRRALGKFALED